MSGATSVGGPRGPSFGRPSLMGGGGGIFNMLKQLFGPGVSASVPNGGMAGPAAMADAPDDIKHLLGFGGSSI
jgi:hypothetical protein